jgi:hypothetical protein
MQFEVSALFRTMQKAALASGLDNNLFEPKA